MNSVSRKPKSGWQQQNCANFMFIPTRGCAIFLYSFIAVTNLIIAGVLMIYSDEIQEYRVQYDCGLTVCEVDIQVTQKIVGPVYFYYEIENYYQNHRIYVKSRSPKQLSGNVYGPSDISECDPITRVSDLTLNFSSLSPNAAADPCGLIAKSYFQDTFSFKNGIKIRQTGIAWDSDLHGKYKNVENWQKFQWQDVEDQHFIVWMRIAATNDFRKFWGIIDQDLEPAVYTLVIDEKMDYSGFDGKKFIVLSNANAFGGKNNVLTYALFISGGLASIWTLVFIFYPCFLKHK